MLLACCVPDSCNNVYGLKKTGLLLCAGGENCVVRRGVSPFTRKTSRRDNTIISMILLG